MPITPYLKGPYYFDLETRRALGIALDMACIALSIGDDDDHVIPILRLSDRLLPSRVARWT